jgi:hypothetical protein
MGVGVFLEGQDMGSEADHSPPFSAEINNKWSLLPLPHIPSWLAKGQLYP